MEIKKCPFDNGECKTQYKKVRGIKLFWVVCNLCLTVTRDFATEEQAIECWNRRVS